MRAVGFALVLILGAGVAKAHKLYPRFIGDLEYGAREVVTVIRKMLNRKETPLETELP